MSADGHDAGGTRRREGRRPEVAHQGVSASRNKSRTVEQRSSSALDLPLDNMQSSQAGAGVGPQAGGASDSARDASSFSAREGNIGSQIQDRLRNMTRFQFLEALFGVAFAAVALRVGYWQTVRSGELAAASKNERTQNTTLAARRGAIYDRNGVVLAQSIDVTTISTDPTVVRDKDIQPIAQELKSRFGGSEQDYAEMLRRPNTRNVVLVDAADPETAADFRSLGYPGLYYTNGYRRIYPLGEVGCSVVGCLYADGAPASGLELQYDAILSGKEGYRTRELGITGGVIVGGQDEGDQAQDGYDVRISIDADIQRTAQETLVSIVEEWQSGEACAVAIDHKTGEILACASTPTFDPNHLERLTDNEALALKPVMSAYEPGSVMKPITMAAAIDSGVCNSSTVYHVPAKVQVGIDWVGDADGRREDIQMTTTNMLERSSNVGTVLVARDLGSASFSDYLSAFGFGQRADVDFPYEAVPPVKKFSEYDNGWEAMSFGQSISATPVQMVRAIGAIANGGILTKPHFLLQVGDEQVHYEDAGRVMSTATADEVGRMMNSVVTNGYGYTGAVEGYNVSAKTGTAERYDHNTGTYSHDRFTVSFVGFAPTENPAVTLYVLVDDVDFAHEGYTVGRPWAEIMQEALTKTGAERSW